jgi:hypothetical protein
MLLGFKKQFIEPLIMGSKILTLRKRRKIQPKVGERLYMYYGLRTNHTTLITNQETLRGIQSCRLTIEKLRNSFKISIWVDRRKLTQAEIEDFVIYDGFTSVTEWATYWLDGKMRTGALMQMFHWTDLKY